jgi:hypothetical protein
VFVCCSTEADTSIRTVEVATTTITTTVTVATQADGKPEAAATKNGPSTASEQSKLLNNQIRLHHNTGYVC